MLSLIITILSLVSFANAADKADPIVTVQVMTAVTYPVSITSAALLQPSISQGMNMSVPIGGSWRYTVELGGTTGFAEFRPGLQVLTGPVKKLGKDFALGVTGVYKFSPAYDGGTASHMIGGGIVPIIPLSFGSLSFPTGGFYNLNTGDVIIATNLKFGIRIP